MTQSNYIVNLIELQNTVTNVSGLSPIQQVQSEVDDLMKMVNFAEKRIFTNIISKYDQSPIQVTDDINLSNANLYQNGILFVGSGSSGGGGGNTSTTIVSSGGTSIILNNTVIGTSTAIAFDVGGRTVFSFDGLGRALYFDPSGTGDRFWVSSATLIADKFQTGADGTAAPGRFLQSLDVSGTAAWAYVSTLRNNIASVSISSGGVFFRTGTSVGVDAGRIDSNQNWYLGAPALVGNNDLVASNSVTVIGGPLRYQGAGTPIAGQYLHIVDSLGNVGLSSLGGGGLSSFVVGDQIQSGSMSVTADGPGQNVTVTSGVNEIARFTAAGFLGLSNATPAATLDVNGSTILNGPLTIQPGSGGSNYVFTSADVVGTGAWAEPLSIFSGSGVTLNQWAVNPGLSAVQGFFGGIEKIRFSTGGAFFGTNGTYKMDVSGIVAASGSLLANTLNVDTTGVFGGAVYATGFFAPSDRRFKENISEIQGALGLVENLQGVRFQWKNDGRRDIGLIAQNVSSVVPEALGGNDTDGYTVAYDKIVPLLVQAVKVLADRVDILERRHR